MKLQTSILILLAFPSIITNAQVTINSNSVVKANGILSTNAPISNRSSGTNLSAAELTLSGTQQSASSNQPVTLSSLKVTEGGTKTMTGNWEITNSLQLINGILRTDANGRLLYSGQTAAEGSETSYIEGYLFLRGSGRKVFPLGANGIYAPLIIENVPSQSAEIGAQVVNSVPQFILPDQTGIAAPHYWELSDILPSTVSLSLNGIDGPDETKLTILQSSAANGNASTLAGTSDAGFITSDASYTQPILTIGRQSEFNVLIHDMITPFILDNINDKLYIENIEQTTSNEVKLYDRWGALVEKWAGYKNDSSYDFSKLSPGNYVCIVDFVLPGDNRTYTSKGMITVLKTK